MKNKFQFPPSGATMRPFANGSEFQAWTCANCDTCARSYLARTPNLNMNQLPDYQKTVKLVERYEECRTKAEIDIASVHDGEISHEAAKLTGWTSGGALPSPCVHWTDNENELTPPDPNQLSLF